MPMVLVVPVVPVGTRACWGGASVARAVPEAPAATQARAVMVGRVAVRVSFRPSAMVVRAVRAVPAGCLAAMAVAAVEPGLSAATVVQVAVVVARSWPVALVVTVALVVVRGCFHYGALVVPVAKEARAARASRVAAGQHQGHPENRARGVVRAAGAEMVATAAGSSVRAARAAPGVPGVLAATAAMVCTVQMPPLQARPVARGAAAVTGPPGVLAAQVVMLGRLVSSCCSALTA